MMDSVRLRTEHGGGRKHLNLGGQKQEKAEGNCKMSRLITCTVQTNTITVPVITKHHPHTTEKDWLRNRVKQTIATVLAVTCQDSMSNTKYKYATE